MGILIIHKNLLSYVLGLVWMCCQIPITVFLRSDDFKRFIIPEHSKNDVADFMHDSPHSHVFFLAFAFVGIVAVDNRIYRCFRPFIYLKVIECYHMQDTSGKAGTSLGHVDFITMKLAGLFYGRIQAEVSIKFLGEENRSKEPISAMSTTALRKPTPRRDWSRRMRS